METRPWFPSPLSVPFMFSVAGCFIFWLAAYVLIVRRGLVDKTFGMPIAALCGNIAWEVLFSHVYTPDYRLVELGNTAWVLFDLGILWCAWKYAPDDFQNPIAKRWVRPMIPIGIAAAMWVAVPFVETYKDTQGYFLGWADAFFMSILFIAMLLRRDSVRGQSIWIGITMFLGNLSAFFWVKYYPTTVLDPRINFHFMTGTGFFNLLYIVLVWQKCRAQGINPWTRA
ncbi:MAG: hypothetical protein B9S33_10170 [Pedosphaera sp. Tous-C6FEB]|nr:MAG: hypothetical protein B9S33_10170 [Pedosphaera sp. Tous-C6FEB]